MGKIKIKGKCQIMKSTMWKKLLMKFHLKKARAKKNTCVLDWSRGYMYRYTDFKTLYCHNVDITNENSRRTRFNFHQYCRSNILETTKQSGLNYKSSLQWIPLMLRSLVMVSSCAISTLIILNASIIRWLRFECNMFVYLRMFRVTPCSLEGRLSFVQLCPS